MLKGIHPAISPELLKTLAEMGHGDEIILADAHFPGHSFDTRILRADGIDISLLCWMASFPSSSSIATPIPFS